MIVALALSDKVYVRGRVMLITMVLICCEGICYICGSGFGCCMVTVDWFSNENSVPQCHKCLLVSNYMVLNRGLFVRPRNIT